MRALCKTQAVVWLSKSVLCQLAAEANRMAPLESGGVLLGYHAESGEAVITDCRGPGPNAVHERFYFLPDQEYHAREIKDAYERSTRRLHYLGDWHSHPGGTAKLSRSDRSTLKRIASFPPARAPRPLMLVIAPGPTWNPVVYEGGLSNGLLHRKLKLTEASLQMF